MRIRLILSFFLIIVVAILSTVIIVRLNTPQQVENFMLRGGMQGLDALATDLEEYYRVNGSWDSVGSVFGTFGSGMMGNGQGIGMKGQRIVLANGNSIIRYDSNGISVGESITTAERNMAITLKNRNKTIGYLLINGGMQISSGSQKPLINRLNNAALQAGMIALVIAIVLAVALAEGILRPIRQLKRAAGQVAAGDWSHEVAVRGKDELAGLAHSFNTMVASLKQSEDRRRDMTADIAHELRTPLAVQRAHLEALQDGIYPLSPENLQPVLDQNVMLVRLVDDLRTLALADAGELRLEKQTVNGGEFLHGMQELFRPAAEEHQIRISVADSLDCPSFQADPDRLTQIFTNLIGNAIRYSPEGSEITLSAECKAGEIHLSVRDGGPGIPNEDLPFIFDRFYRVNKSRSKVEGGSGLGLAIARQLAEVHGGRLTVENLPGGGTQFTLILPREIGM